MKLNLTGIQDPIIRDNFRKLEEAFRVMSLLNGNWKLFEETFEVSATTVNIPHNLPFVPTDVIVLSAIGDQNYSFISTDFSASVIPVYISGPVTLRFLVGRAK